MPKVTASSRSLKRSQRIWIELNIGRLASCAVSHSRDNDYLWQLSRITCRSIQRAIKIEAFSSASFVFKKA